MSAAAEMWCCASCGVAETDDIKLVPCDGCDLVTYCSDDCQNNHRSEHAANCRKRAAELNDELLFKQPESTHLGDCPICLLPIQLRTSQDPIVRYTMYSCCSKSVCLGCEYAIIEGEIDLGQPHSCPFCRTPELTAEEMELNQQKRAAKNDPNALHQMGCDYSREGDHSTAIEYWEKAAGIGNFESHNQLSWAYQRGLGVAKDKEKFIFHLEQAAIGGHPNARHNLGVWELTENYNPDRAANHFIIAANQGFDSSIEVLKKLYTQEMVSKEDYAAALSTHQAALDAMKSPQRDTAEAFQRDDLDEGGGSGMEE